MKSSRALFILLMFLFVNPAWAQRDDVLEQINIHQNINTELPLDTIFYDENGQKVLLKDYFSQTPVLLTFVYYNCPMLCSLNLQSLAKSLQTLGENPGKDYQLLVISFDPNDMGADSKLQLNKFLKLMGHSSSEGVHFLTGPFASIAKITKATGFQYVKNEDNGQYAHSTALVVATPQGTISRYFFGLDYPQRDIKLALAEAKQNKHGSLTRQILLYCFLYHPQTGRYTLAVFNILKIAAVITIVLLFSLIYLLRKEEKHS